MKKVELHKQPGMEEFFSGGSLEYEIENQIIGDENRMFALLDKICLSENLIPLSSRWNKISFKDGDKLLMDALSFDLAYTKNNRMPKENAQYFHDQILGKINAEACQCYTNWFQNPWEDNTGVSWNSVTRNTFDIAIVFIDSKRLIFTYLISED